MTRMLQLRNRGKGFFDKQEKKEDSPKPEYFYGVGTEIVRLLPFRSN